MNSRVIKLITKNFGQNPLTGYSFYNAEKRLDDIRRYHNALSESAKETDGKDDKSTIGVIDNITWDDLEMDRVFLRVNHTNSFIGEQVLFHKLHMLDKGVNPDLASAQEHITEFYDKNPQERIEAEARISYIGKNKEAYHLIQFLLNSEIWKLGNTIAYHILQAILVICIVGTIVFHNPFWIAGLVAIAVVNLFVYTVSKMKYEIMFNSLSDFKSVYDCAKWMVARYKGNDAFDSDAVTLSLHNTGKMSKIILGMNRRRKNAMTGDVLAIMLEYVWGIFLIDISLFNYVLNVINGNIDDVITILNYVGEIDSAIAVLSYRHSVDRWCKPGFSSEYIDITGVIHPLIEHPTDNDFVLNTRAIITGANASGKSTFMKAVAINCILAQTINTCTATGFELKPLHIITCMSLRDDVISGESYYFREAKYLKRMLDIIADNSEVLIVIDEILKGTNTAERIAASKAILEYITGAGCFALVATHDRELTDNPLYNDYYFTSIVDNNDIKFEYRIHEGTTLDTNAIDLLSFLKYPDRIIDQAREYMNVYREGSETKGK